MAHFPEPFFKKSRGVWCVEINRKQINFGPDKDEPFRQYDQPMGQSRGQVVSADLLVDIINAFLEWTHKNRAPDIYEWYRYRLQRFATTYPDTQNHRRALRS